MEYHLAASVLDKAKDVMDIEVTAVSPRDAWADFSVWLTARGCRSAAKARKHISAWIYASCLWIMQAVGPVIG